MDLDRLLWLPAQKTPSKVSPCLTAGCHSLEGVFVFVPIVRHCPVSLSAEAAYTSGFYSAKLSLFFESE
jgi:hypothetical protein